MGRIIKNGIVYGGCTFGFQPIIYSTEEREVGVWLDGKPLYQKSLSVTNTAGSYSVNIASLNADAVIRVDIYLHNNTGGDYICGTYYESNYDKLNYYFTSNKQSIVIRAGQTYAIGSGYITLYYTKTTDTAGSGTWTPQGIPTVHYSTEEQVIGTWVTGAALYQKTYIYTPANSGPLSVASLNIDKIIDMQALSHQTSGVAEISVPYGWDSGDRALFYYHPVNKTLNFSYSAQNAGEWYITIKYTKVSS